MNYTKHIPLWIVLSLLGFFTYYTCEIGIGGDMSWYVNSALNIFAGKGYTEQGGELILKRAPLFPMMIAGSYHLLGPSPWSAYWVVRIFCILNPIIVYFIGKKIFGRWVGFSASLLILTSYSINFWSYRHLDAVWPFFALLSVYLTNLALEKKKISIIVLSAVSISLSYHVKEASIVLLVLPLLLLVFVKEYRCRSNYIGVFVYFIVFFITIFPWFYHVHSVKKDVLEALIGARGQFVSKDVLFLSPFLLLKTNIEGLFSFFYNKTQNSQSVYNNFMVAPFFFAAWIYNFYKSIKKDRGSILLTSVFILLIPYAAFVGANNLRVGHLIVLMLISYLALSQFVFDGVHLIFKSIKKKYSERSPAISVVILAVVLLIMGGQTFHQQDYDKGNLKFLNMSYLYRVLTLKNTDFKVVDLYNKLDQEAGLWIKKHLPSGSSLMVSSSGDRVIYFFTQGQYPIVRFPEPYFCTGKGMNRYDLAKSTKQIKKNIIYLTSWYYLADPRNWISVLTEDELYATIKKESVKFIVIHRWTNFLSLYFDTHAGFERIKDFGDGAIKIYKVGDLSDNLLFKPMIVKRLTRYLKELRKTDPEKITLYIKDFFIPILGWGEDEVKRLENLPTTPSTKLSDFNVVANGEIYP